MRDEFNDSEWAAICRRVATRYGKLAANYHSFIQLESIRLWLRVNAPTP